MNTFQVWVKPTDYGHVLMVDGLHNASWLLDQLGRSFVFRSAEPIGQAMNSSVCSFQVPSGPFVSSNQLHQLLAKIPEVKLSRIAPKEQVG